MIKRGAILAATFTFFILRLSAQPIPDSTLKKIDSLFSKWNNVNSPGCTVGIVRNDVRLQRAMRRLDLLWEETEQLYESSSLSPQLLQLRNMITVGYLIVKGASFRKESRGLHFNTDYPNKSNLVQNIVL